MISRLTLSKTRLKSVIISWQILIKDTANGLDPPVKRFEQLHETFSTEISYGSWKLSA